MAEFAPLDRRTLALLAQQYRSGEGATSPGELCKALSCDDEVAREALRRMVDLGAVRHDNGGIRHFRILSWEILPAVLDLDAAASKPKDRVAAARDYARGHPVLSILIVVGTIAIAIAALKPLWDSAEPAQPISPQDAQSDREPRTLGSDR